MKTLNLSVPKPCSEKWESFARTNTGGFCGSCQKNVIDFTKVSDDEIYLFFKNNPAHACGRFKTSQLKTYSDSTRLVHIAPGMTLLKAGFLSLLFMLINRPASAQSVQAKPTVEMVKKVGETVAVMSLGKEQTVKGTIISMEDGSAIAGVNVGIKGTTKGTCTDADGKFLLTANEGDVLYFAFIGLETKEQVVPRAIDDAGVVYLTIDLAADYQELMGEISVETPYTSKSGWVKNTWQKIKELF